jgi:hypothetical protein
MSALLLILLPWFAGQSATQKYQRTDCAYAFEYPQGWQVVKNDDYVEDRCTTTIRPTDYAKRMAEGDDVDLWTITIVVSGRSFPSMAGENGFDFNGKWIVLGRMGIKEEAQITNANGWLILRGVATVGCGSAKGGYAGLCEEPRVIAKRQDDPHVAAIAGGPQTQAVIQVILRTLKFLPV